MCIIRVHVRRNAFQCILEAKQSSEPLYGADADGAAYWRHLANTIEMSVCGGSAAVTNYFDHLL